MMHMDFEKIVLLHAKKYPLMQAQDFVKLAYQAAFGCGHMVSNFETALARVKAERRSDAEGVYAEDIGNGYVRLYLTGGEYPLASETAARLFVLSAEAVSENKDTFRAFSEILKALSKDKKIAPDTDAMERALGKFESGDFAPVSHTEAYRAAYRPAYRVIRAEYARYLPLISKLDSLKRAKNGAVIAVDGMCASGKTTLAKLLSDALDAPVYHMDDFFLPPVKRTKERLNAPGGNVDYERFRTDVLDPLLMKKPFSFRPFDCSIMDFADAVSCESADLSIVEGSYSCHPALSGDYDFRIFMSVDPEKQLERIRMRNGEKMLVRFKNEWIPMENRYFEAFDIPGKADYTVHI